MFSQNHSHEADATKARKLSAIFASVIASDPTYGHSTPRR